MSRPASAKDGVDHSGCRESKGKPMEPSAAAGIDGSTGRVSDAQPQEEDHEAVADVVDEEEGFCVEHSNPFDVTGGQCHRDGVRASPARAGRRLGAEGVGAKGAPVSSPGTSPFGSRAHRLEGRLLGGQGAWGGAPARRWAPPLALCPDRQFKLAPQATKASPSQGRGQQHHCDEERGVGMQRLPAL